MDLFNLFKYYSYWLIVWFFLYQFGYTKYNPIVSFFCSIVFILTFILLRKDRILPKIILLLIIQLVYLKILPFLYLEKEISLENIRVELLMFIIYNLYLLINKTDLLSIYTRLFDNFEKNNFGNSLVTTYFVKLYDKYL